MADRNGFSGVRKLQDETIQKDAAETRSPFLPPPRTSYGLNQGDQNAQMRREYEADAKKAEGKDVWEGGKILDPENGKTYTLRLTPIEGGAKLEVRGSIGPFGRTQTWVRVQ